ncbi:MAG: AmmeMemoRadiSam system protein A [Bifidobacteriaceae bacterium]|jgi:AmmeMemoRadiSam system protein A|nr:AmmeMemoRadiSam system protein A [Bifidobacteriaceae bacterium]
MPSDFPPAAGPLLTGLAREAIECVASGRRPPSAEVSALLDRFGPAAGGLGQGGAPTGRPVEAGMGGEPASGPASRIGEPAGLSTATARTAPAGPGQLGPELAGWDFLARPGAAFVTLTRHGELRGCIGSLEAHRPLAKDVQYNAIDAAFGDPRFAPLPAGEVDRVDIEVSVLSEPLPLAFADRADLAGQLRPGVDGLVLAARGRRGTFLPQVWDQLPTPELFLAHLVRKAGLPAGYWDGDVRIWRYTVTAFEEDRTASADRGVAEET